MMVFFEIERPKHEVEAYRRVMTLANRSPAGNLSDRTPEKMYYNGRIYG